MQKSEEFKTIYQFEYIIYYLTTIWYWLVASNVQYARKK